VNAVPQSFSDFGEESLRPDYVVKSSYGNDSIALIQFMHEYHHRFLGFNGVGPCDLGADALRVALAIGWAEHVGCDGGFCVS
jgi:hypothetical protein